MNIVDRIDIDRRNGKQTNKHMKETARMHLKHQRNYNESLVLSGDLLLRLTRAAC